MAEHVYETSAAVKHYRAELGTAKVDGVLADTASCHYLTTLSVVEAHSAFSATGRYTVPVSDAASPGCRPMRRSAMRGIRSPAPRRAPHTPDLLHHRLRTR